MVTFLPERNAGVLSAGARSNRESQRPLAPDIRIPLVHHSLAKQTRGVAPSAGFVHVPGRPKEDLCVPRLRRDIMPTQGGFFVVAQHHP